MFFSFIIKCLIKVFLSHDMSSHNRLCMSLLGDARTLEKQQRFGPITGDGYLHRAGEYAPCRRESAARDPRRYGRN